MDPVAALNHPAPDFHLPDLDGQAHSPPEAAGRILVLVFWSAECPWSERTDRALIDLQSGWGREVVVWRIASNANESDELIRRTAAERGLGPVLRDANQQAARLYAAQTTPHVFALDRQGVLRYAGAFDDVTFRRREPSRSYLKEAVQALREGRTPDPQAALPYGCALVYGFE